mmetsp:Transcript_7714/g.23772  ORF Transcript_7714/g.23772 Transcript_7714/m.23772 type:complete len:316 (+) Transcript_7714:1455-2402(+)
MGVTGGGLHLEDAVLDAEQTHIERTSTEIEDEHGALTAGLLVQTVGDGGRGRLVDDAVHGETGDGAGVLGGLALGVVEVGRHSDDRILDFLAEVVLGDLLHLGEHHGRDLLRGEALGLTLVLHLDVGLVAVSTHHLEREVLHVVLHIRVVELAADQTLGVEDGVRGVHGHLVLGGVTDQTLGVGEGDVRRGGTVTLVVGDHFAAIVLPDSHTRVGGTQIDTDARSLNALACHCVVVLLCSYEINRCKCGERFVFFFLKRSGSFCVARCKKEESWENNKAFKKEKPSNQPTNWRRGRAEQSRAEPEQRAKRRKSLW